jgi:hypothetical protein
VSKKRKREGNVAKGSGLQEVATVIAGGARMGGTGQTDTYITFRALHDPVRMIARCHQLCSLSSTLLQLTCPPTLGQRRCPQGPIEFQCIVHFKLGASTVYWSICLELTFSVTSTQRLNSGRQKPTCGKRIRGCTQAVLLCFKAQHFALDHQWWRSPDFALESF